MSLTIVCKLFIKQLFVFGAPTSD